MDGEIRYNFGSIADLTSGMTVKWQSLNEKLDEIKSSIQPLVATWQGADADAYQVRQGEWNAAQAELNTVLQSLIGAVSAGNQKMIEQEALNRSRFA
ncbi:WXG100 family type VII secretion target [Rhodococcoides kyotonense]|uniref:ESAT-6-like protein n=1 Tax=Rhodococcoides kyotonense TaxID=398843 RepID=A0A239MQC7_9NOCA|nr:WXG100 family type VII secretion target [Rhodococcus kyotonensis]SNT44453.1 WXG100 family type VII secretion target [Rhodococcus kyotonensis]